MSELVRITVPQLVRLNREGVALPLYSRSVLSRQAGDYQSPFKGRGMEFEESRLYQPGDDVRNIDWRVTARTNRVHTKLYREGRERPVILFVDFRASMFFATRGRFKSVAAAQLASLLGWSAAYQGDRVGGLLFSEDAHQELKPQRGRTTVLRLIKQMVAHPSWSCERTAAVADPGAGKRALLRLRSVVRPGSLVFLLSDFRYLDDPVSSGLVQLRRHCELVLVFIFDPLERELPPPGLYPISDDLRRHVLDTYDQSWVKAYRQRFAARAAGLARLAQQNGIHLMSYSTADNPFQVLQAGLRARSTGR